MDESKENIDALRENLLASLGDHVTITPVDGADDFNTMEEELVTQVLEVVDYNRGAADRRFAQTLQVATEERRRQIRNARALDRIAGTVNIEEFWR